MRRLVPILIAAFFAAGVPGWTAAHMHLAHGAAHTHRTSIAESGRAERLQQPSGNHSCCSDHGQKTQQRDGTDDCHEHEQQTPSDQSNSPDHDSDCIGCSLLAVVTMLSAAVPPVDHISVAVDAVLDYRLSTTALPSPRGIWARPPPALI